MSSADLPCDPPIGTSADLEVTHLPDLTPAAAQGWSVLFAITAEDPEHCLLVGGG